MIHALYRKFFYLYYITSMVLITFIIFFALYSNYRSVSLNKELLFQSYTRSIILQLQNDVIVSDATMLQFGENIPMLFLLVDDNNNVINSFYPNEIKTSYNILQEEIKNQLSQTIKTDQRESCYSIDNSVVPHVYTFELKGPEGENFKWSYINIDTQKGRKYELFTAYLLNHNILTAPQLIQYFKAEILLLIIFFFLGKYIAKTAIIPIEQNMKNQKNFIASASHELKTPLSVISLANAANQLDSKHIIDQECNRMDKIIKNLLFLASSESCTWNTDFQMLNFEMLLIEFYEMSQSLLKENGKKIEFKFPDTTIEDSMFDKSLILQLLTILLDNAITYSGTNNLITIELAKKKTKLILYFIDYGAGISDNDKPYIFNSFYKTRSSLSNHYGLGLSIAKTIVNLHHGIISVHDTPGGGATFIIEFPVLAETS